ncbi:phage holin family protein [Nesterenkonia alba]|uniref:phage holin family protein n=1 Tax=Nesterenkonia alba TaxID=515814 RepID=UPI0003B3BE99|nr:phage holin family protein [Nesterenkonia alba]
MSILLAIILNALALGAAVLLVPNLTVEGWDNDPIMVILAYLVVGAIFGVVNTFIKPVIQVLALPITVLTLGLFMLVINALMLMLTGWLTNWIPGVQLDVGGFIPALLGSIVISVVSLILSRFIFRGSER